MAGAERRGERGGYGRVVYPLLGLFLVLILATGVVAYLGYLPDVQDEPRATAQAPSSVLVQPPATSPGLTFDPAPAPEPVLEPIATDPVSAALVRRALHGVVAGRGLGRHLGLAVAALHTDRLLWSSGRTDMVVPASTIKLLTCVTALQTMSPAHKFRTSVVDGATRRDIVLVGGGDPLLTDKRLTPAQARAASPVPATLEDLAAQTARVVKARGRKTVSLSYDDSLFRGPAVSPAWESDYLTDFVVSPISALWVDEGRATPGYAHRTTDPAAEAARRFATQLSARGVTVGARITRGRAEAAARTVASVSSAPLADIVQHVLELSDNEAAEVLLRQSAIAAGRPGSFAGGVATVRAVMEDLDVDLPRARIFDGSGLSRHDKVPVTALVDVLQVAADPAHPQLRTVVSGLPVAGFTGSLDYRFVDGAPTGLGVVRAKTGTLTGVHALAGIVTTADDQVLVFAAVADRVRAPRTLDARRQLEVIAAALATCRCAR